MIVRIDSRFCKGGSGLAQLVKYEEQGIADDGFGPIRGIFSVLFIYAIAAILAVIGYGIVSAVAR